MRNQEFITLGSTLIILGIVFGSEDRLLGYSLIGVGVLLSIVSAIKMRRKIRLENHRTGGV